MNDHTFLALLRQEHFEQKKIGKLLIDAKKPEEKEKYRQSLFTSLFPHIIGEEASMFARLKEAEDEEVRADALEGLQEHHVAKILLQELMDMSTDTEEFTAKVKVLDESNKHHIEEEERDIFSHLLSLCTEEELKNLYNRYNETAEKTKNESKP